MRDNLNFIKLENKLHEIEKTSPISNDAELICAIEAIIDAECISPDDERDYGLIDEAIKMVASLKGIDPKDLEDKANLCADEIIRKIKEKKK